MKKELKLFWIWLMHPDYYTNIKDYCKWENKFLKVLLDE